MTRQNFPFLQRWELVGQSSYMERARIELLRFVLQESYLPRRASRPAEVSNKHSVCIAYHRFDTLWSLSIPFSLSNSISPLWSLPTAWKIFSPFFSPTNMYLAGSNFNKSFPVENVLVNHQKSPPPLSVFILLQRVQPLNCVDVATLPLASPSYFHIVLGPAASRASSRESCGLVSRVVLLLIVSCCVDRWNYYEREKKVSHTFLRTYSNRRTIVPRQ